MKLSKEGRLFIQSAEHLSLSPYLDGGGVPTIGYGNTKYPSGKSVSMRDKPLSVGQAEELFEWSLQEYEKAVNEAMDIELKQNEFDALVSLCYNIGVGAFKKSTLVKIQNRKDGMLQEADQILRWNKDNGVEVKGLTNRRRAERCLFLGIEDG